MVALRLFLPESWTSDRVRLKRAGVPAEYQPARTKPEIALAETDRVIAAGVRFGCVLADAGYGMSAPFRQGLTARNLAWAVGIPRHLKVYPVGVKLIWPGPKRAAVPVSGICPIFYRWRPKTCWPDAKWQTVSWRNGTKGRLKARFAAVRVRTADGPPQRIRDKGQQHLPGDEAWLIGEHRMSGEKKYYLANLPAGRPAQLGRHHQGAMDLRAGPSAAERRTRPRPLRGTFLAGPSPSCAHDHDRLRLPPASPPHKSEAGKKESTGRRLNHVTGRAPRHRQPHHRTTQRCPHCRRWIDAAKQRDQNCQSSARP